MIASPLFTRAASAENSPDIRKLSFDMDPEVIEIQYDKYDGSKPKRMYRDPTKPYCIARLKTSWVNMSRMNNLIGRVPARAKAIIIDMNFEHRDVDTVAWVQS